MSIWLNIAAEVGIVALPVGLLMIAGTLGLGVVVGLINGLLTTRTRIPPFLITWLSIVAELV